MSEHTKGPWRVSSHDGCTVVVGRGLGEASIADCYDWMESTKEANARRIVAAVNACEGVPLAELEDLAALKCDLPGIGGVAQMAIVNTKLEAERDALKSQVAELVAALEHIADGMLTGLIASRIARAALSKVRP